MESSKRVIISHVGSSASNSRTNTPEKSDHPNTITPENFDNLKNPIKAIALTIPMPKTDNNQILPISPLSKNSSKNRKKVDNSIASCLLIKNIVFYKCF